MGRASWWLGPAVVPAAAMLIVLWRDDHVAPTQAIAPTEGGPAAPGDGDEPLQRDRVQAASRAATNDAAAPAADAPAADAYEEWEDGSWRKLQHPVDEGAMQVLVLRGKEPVADARVRLWPHGERWTLQSKEAEPPVRKTHTDATGQARFPRIPDGRYVVRADVGDDHAMQPHLVVPSPETARTLVLVLGRSSIEGSVYDHAGAPLVATEVWLAAIGPLSRSAIGRTDREGRFRVGGLSSGRYHVYVRHPIDDEAPAERVNPHMAEYERMVKLGVEDRVTMLFGRPLPFATWTGRIIDAEGQGVPGSRRLHLRNQATNDERRSYTNDDGSFACELPPGKWSAHAAGKGMRPGDHLVTVDVSAQGVQRDLRWPGIRLIAELLPQDPARFDAEVAASDVFLRVPGEVDMVRGEGPFTVAGTKILQWLTLAPGAREIHVQGEYALSVDNGKWLPVKLSEEALVERVQLPLYQRN